MPCTGQLVPQSRSCTHRAEEGDTHEQHIWRGERRTNVAPRERIRARLAAAVGQQELLDGCLVVVRQEAARLRTPGHEKERQSAEQGCEDALLSPVSDRRAGLAGRARRLRAVSQGCANLPHSKASLRGREWGERSLSLSARVARAESAAQAETAITHAGLRRPVGSDWQAAASTYEEAAKSAGQRAARVRRASEGSRTSRLRNQRVAHVDVTDRTGTPREPASAGEGRTEGVSNG